MNLSTSLSSQEAVLYRQGKDCHRATPKDQRTHRAKIPNTQVPRHWYYFLQGFLAVQFLSQWGNWVVQHRGCTEVDLCYSKAKVSFCVNSLTDSIPNKYYSLSPTVTNMQMGKRDWSTFAAALTQHSEITAVHPSLHFLRSDSLLY